MSAGTRRIGWGLIGASDIAARFLVPAIRAQGDADVLGVMSHSAERAAEFAAHSGIPGHHTSVDALLADPAITAVYVSSDNRHHLEQVLAAAATGRAVLCEKPLAMSVADAARMVTACRDAGVVMGTNHHLRTARAIEEMRRLIAAGAIGTPLSARVAHLANLPAHLRTWRVLDPAAGGGPINDMGTHDFDVLRHVFGREVLEVTAVTTNQGLAAPGIEDQFMAALRLEGGVIASVHAAYNIGFAGSALDVHGSEGTLLGRMALSAVGGAEVRLLDAGGEHEVDLGPQPVAYIATVAAFQAAMRGQGAPAATGEDGLHSLAIAAAVREAAARGVSVAVRAV